MYRLLKANTPAITTFILPATSEVPKRLMHPKKKPLVCIPSNPVAQAFITRTWRTVTHQYIDLA